MTHTQNSRGVAVYCASSLGNRKAFQEAATSTSETHYMHESLSWAIAGLGFALAEAGRPLVYGGGNKGIMGVVSGAALEKGGKVTGVVPYAMVAAGGEAEQMKGTSESKGATVALDEHGREAVCTCQTLMKRDVRSLSLVVKYLDRTCEWPFGDGGA